MKSPEEPLSLLSLSIHQRPLRALLQYWIGPPPQPNRLVRYKTVAGKFLLVRIVPELTGIRKEFIHIPRMELFLTHLAPAKVGDEPWMNYTGKDSATPLRLEIEMSVTESP